MILAESHLNDTLKLIGDDIKNQVQKLVIPLSDLFGKIPKLTHINQNKSTLLIKDYSNNQKKRNKGKKSDIINKN